MRKNVQKLVTKLVTRISRDEEHLGRLRHASDSTHYTLEAAQVAADEARRTFDQLRIASAVIPIGAETPTGK